MNDTVESPEAENSGTEISTIPEYTKTETALTKLEKQLANVVYDVSTVKGLDAAKKDRAKLRTLRTSLDKLRKELNQEDQKRIATRNEQAKAITGRISALEDPIDEQIKKREDEQQRAREERERAEAERLRVINDAIAALERIPLEHLDSTADQLAEAITALEADELATFDDVHMPTARAVRDASLDRLRKMHMHRVEIERQSAENAAAEARLAAEREELERLRAEQEQRDRDAEEQRQREAQEREEADKARRLADEHVDDLRSIPASLVGRPAEVIRSAIAEVKQIDPNDPRFGHRRVDADAARVSVLNRLGEMLAASEESERVAAEQAERQRQLDEQQAGQQRQEQERAERQQREEEERQANEREEFERQAEHRRQVEREDFDRRQAEADAADAEARRRDAMLYLVTMPDGSVWSVPLMEIVRSRAEHYAHEFGDDIERSIAEDTLPLFESDPYQVKDWASNNMNWSEVVGVAKIHAPAKPLEDDDFEEGWINGSYSVSIPGGAA